jgi:hypothetical protein
LQGAVVNGTLISVVLKTMATTTIEKLKKFKARLPENYYFSVKDLIDYVILEKMSDGEIKKYVQGWQEVTRAQLKFHQAWINRTNIKNIAEYEKEEIAMLDKLLGIL